MTFEQQWIEYDYNPFVLFSSNVKVLSLNSEAQFLLGFVTTEELFNLATTYANVSFGFKTTLDLSNESQSPKKLILSAFTLPVFLIIKNEEPREL